MIMVDPGPLPTADRIDLGQEPAFDLGGVRVLPSDLAVATNGDRHELQPRVMQVLVALAKARPEVVSRDKLIELCWGGRIVGDDALNRCILALRHLAQEIAPPPFTIETVPRIGHRLVEKAPDRGGSARRRWETRPWPLALVFGLLLIVLGGAWFFLQQRGEVSKPASIAVLPFRNLSQDRSFFAEGVGEEILAQLAREPEFRVAGRASAGQFESTSDPREVGRKLGVDYVLEGSVRSDRGRVRVNAGLVRASDGIRLWSDTYDGKLDDIFAIQRQIGAAIGSALQRKLVRAPALAGPLVTKGEAYTLYLTARTLIRTRHRRVGSTASDLLRDAIRIDPGYAPAWASLADATLMEGALGNRETFVAAVRKARAYAGHALRLAPDLAEAHRAFGRTLGYGDPKGLAHLRRAAALEPNDAENLIELGTALGAEGEFERELAVYRRANALDPLWYRTTGVTALGWAEMGNRAEAEAFGRRSLPDKGANLQILLGRIGWIYADYSEAARQWHEVARSRSPRWANTAERTLHDATHAVGVSTGALVDVPEPPASRSNWRAWMDVPPAPAVWKQRNRDAIAADVYRKHNLVAAKLMLNAGRGRELAETYDGPTGLFGLGPRKRARIDQIREAPTVALALRQAGRGSEAEQLLAEAAAAVQTAYHRGQVPFWFDADAAALFAAQGLKADALEALERAFDRGWRQNGASDLREIKDEPAFRALHGEPRFERLRTRLAAHYARERDEVARLRLS
jgi:TolB-like protein/DNA-binding winged helix-turn-helix (wHTH) protein/tetratricopeptide (TPR) repeat protein